MNKLLGFFILISFSSCATLKYLNAFDGFNGKPKVIDKQTFMVETTDGKQIEELGSIDIIYYDSKGRITKHLDLGADRRPFGKWTYTYDKYGNLIAFGLIESDMPISSPKKTHYNKYGQVVKVESKNRIQETTYDRDKMEAVELRKKADGSITVKTVFKFNEDWRQVEFTEYEGSDQFKVKIKTKYDSKGNQIESQWFNAEDLMHSLYKLEYNGQGHRIRTESYSISEGDTVLQKFTQQNYVYDKKMNVIQKTTKVNGEVKYIERNKITY